MADSIYSTTSTAWGGREGRASSEDGRVDVTLSVPKEMGGDAGPGTNPEQLFATGYAACFGSAVEGVGKMKKFDVTGAAVTVAASLLKGDDGFSLAVKLSLKAPALSKEQAQELIEAAHQMCPYSKATRGNIPVELVVE